MSEPIVTERSATLMLIGTVWREGGQNFNAMILAEGGRVLGRTYKHELPNYGTFDEKRIFTPGPLPEPFELTEIRREGPAGPS